MPTDVPNDVAGLDDTLSVPPDSRPREPEPEPPRRIGPYRLLQLIGEGGMGEVWVAEQVEPVRRRVALKVIKAGMDTKQVVARFEAERQALALMDHPAIAKVLDGGSTPEGRPYFVMEYVPGVSLTEHCDTHRLPTEERLKLFMEVCEGVQHAHQKAVIHRDLKPSNILVSLVDGRAQPKIIDFGIAKATGQRLTEKTLFTEVGSVIGTPEYMSPEQADLTNQDIDTRTDVYSLGVILYQLLTGELPFASADLRSSSYEELRRKLREVDPPRPSTRLSTANEGAAQAARNRNTDSGGLRRELAGDLDAITLKTLEKDRARRYGTPSEVADDIARYLAHRPVIARPPSRAYRIERYVRRHRVGVLIAAALVLSLVGFAGLMAVQTRRIAVERDRANAEKDRAARAAAKSARVTEFLKGMFNVLEPGEGSANSITARQILDNASKDIERKFPDDPELRGTLLSALGEVYFGLNLFYEGRSLFERALDVRRRELGSEHPDTLRSMTALAIAAGLAPGLKPDDLRHSLTDGAKLAREALETQQRVLGPEHPDTLQSMMVVGSILLSEGKLSDAEALQRETLASRRRILGSDHLDTLWSILRLSHTLAMRGELKEAQELSREALATYRRVLGPDDPSTLRAMIALATVLRLDNQLAAAEQLLRAELDAAQKRFGQEHPKTLAAMHRLAKFLDFQGRLAEAEGLQREAMAIRRRTRPDEEWTLRSMSALAGTLAAEGKLREAESVQREMIDIRRRVSGTETFGFALAQYNLASILAKEGKRNAAISILHGLFANEKLTDPLRGNLVWRLLSRISKNPDFSSLHGDERFEAMAVKVKSEPNLKAATTSLQVLMDEGEILGHARVRCASLG